MISALFADVYLLCVLNRVVLRYNMLRYSAYIMLLICENVCNIEYGIPLGLYCDVFKYFPGGVEWHRLNIWIVLHVNFKVV